MTEADKRYFDSLLSKMPDKPGLTKWICGADYHTDAQIHSWTDKCPQCGETTHPARGYAEGERAE